MDLSCFGPNDLRQTVLLRAGHPLYFCHWSSYIFNSYYSCILKQESPAVNSLRATSKLFILEDPLCKQYTCTVIVSGKWL